MLRCRTTIAAAAALACLWLSNPTPANAHAQLIASTPTAGKTVNDSPTTVTITLSSPPQQPGRDTLAVFNAQGQRVDTANVTHQAHTVRTNINTQLPTGTYTVTYRVVGTDGHLSAGQFTFTTTKPPPADAEPAGNLAEWTVPPRLRLADTAGGPAPLGAVSLPTTVAALAAATAWAGRRRAAQAEVRSWHQD